MMLEVEEHIKATIAGRVCVVRSFGLESDSRVRLQVEGAVIELKRAEWADLMRVMERVLTPLHTPPAPEPASVEKKQRRPKAAPRSGKPWTEQECRELETGWAAGEQTLQDLAHEHQRTVGAIIARLVVMGLCKNSDEARSINAERMDTWPAPSVHPLPSHNPADEDGRTGP